MIWETIITAPFAAKEGVIGLGADLALILLEYKSSRQPYLVLNQSNTITYGP